jgi:hypothetical protein
LNPINRLPSGHCELSKGEAAKAKRFVWDSDGWAHPSVTVAFRPNRPPSEQRMRPKQGPRRSEWRRGKAKRRRTGTDEEKAEALALLTANEGNLAQTAVQLRVPRKTLERWKKWQASSTEMAELRH